MKPYFVVNPRSANGATGRRWLELDAQVSRVVGPHGLGFTAGPLDAVRLTREALRSGYDCVVAVGGDGTLNEVVNGFFEEGRLRGAGREPRRPAAGHGRRLPAHLRLELRSGGGAGAGAVRKDATPGRGRAPAAVAGRQAGAPRTS